MRLIACSLQVTGQAAHTGSRRAVPPGDIAHASAETYGISADDSLFTALVTQYDHAVVVVSFVKLEGAQVDPGAASHLLVDGKLCDSTFMEYQVFGISDAFRLCAVRHIDCIASCFRDVRNPFGKGLCLFPLCGGCDTDAAVIEWIFPVQINLFQLCKSRSHAFLPPTSAVGIFVVDGARRIGVIINNHFPFLPVTFTWCEYDSPRVFQHRYQIRDDERLGEQVFRGTE